MKLTRIPHLDGDPGVAQTIRQMRRLISEGKKDPAVHDLAAQILTRAGVRAYDWEGEARAIYDAVRRNLRFTRDPVGNETLTDAPNIIRLKIGDCDDFTVLICSLMQTIGADCRIVTVATDPAPDAEFSHVYPEAQINGRWVAMDAARQSPAFGKSPEHYTRKRVWDLDSDGYTDMAGLRTSIAPGQGPQGAWRANVYPQFRVATRRMTGSYLSAQPVAPPHQQFKRPPLGHGNYGPAAARRALGDFSRADRRRVFFGMRGMGDAISDAENQFLQTGSTSLPGVFTTPDSSGFDWSSLAPAITAGTVGAANIISAERASPYNLFPTTSVATRPVSPSPLMPITSSIGGISSTTLLLGGALVIGLIAMEGRR